MKNILLRIKSQYKFAIVTVVFLVWGGLVIAGIAPAEPFINALRSILIAFGFGF